MSKEVVWTKIILETCNKKRLILFKCTVGEVV